MNKKPDITAQTRANILEAFWSLYRVKRIDQITVKEITSKAGYNRGTFYEYFRDVYDCLEQIELQVLPSLDELPPKPGIDEGPSKIFQDFLDLYEEKLNYYQVLLGEHGDPRFQSRLIESIKRTLFTQPQFGTIEPLPDSSNRSLDLDIFLEYHLSGMISILRYYYEKEIPIPKAEIMSKIHTLLLGNQMKSLYEQPSPKETFE